MKILTLSHNPGPSGAGRAALRLHRALRQTGIDADMMIGRPAPDTPDVGGGALAIQLMRLTGRLEARRSESLSSRNTGQWFTSGAYGVGWSLATGGRSADICHLHWINSGFLSSTQLRGARAPIVWTLHDMWSFTGGCHYAASCRAYETQCQNCPAIQRTDRRDPALRGWRAKQAVYADLDITVVTPSRWLGDQAKSSALFRSVPVEVIHNALDLSVFKPMDKAQARQALGLPAKAPVIVAGAAMLADLRKGADLLLAAAAQLRTRPEGERPIVLLLGASAPEGMAELDTVELRTTGFITEEPQMVQHLSAADVAVLPSREENLSNMMAEAIACGVPVIGFDIGGNSDLIIPGVSGALVPEFDTHKMAIEIDAILDRAQEDGALSASSRKIAEEKVDSGVVARQHAQLYERILAERGSLSSR